MPWITESSNLSRGSAWFPADHQPAKEDSESIAFFRAHEDSIRALARTKDDEILALQNRISVANQAMHKERQIHAARIAHLEKDMQRAEANFLNSHVAHTEVELRHRRTTASGEMSVDANSELSTWLQDTRAKADRLERRSLELQAELEDVVTKGHYHDLELRRLKGTLAELVGEHQHATRESQRITSDLKRTQVPQAQACKHTQACMADNVSPRARVQRSANEVTTIKGYVAPVLPERVTEHTSVPHKMPSEPIATDAPQIVQTELGMATRSTVRICPVSAPIIRVVPPAYAANFNHMAKQNLIPQRRPL